VVPNLSNKLILAAASAIAVVGLVDAAVAAAWDLVVLIGMILGLHVVLWIQLSWGRPAVPLRADLVRWLGDRAVAGGEPVERVADRAVAAYRVGLSGRDSTDAI